MIWFQLGREYKLSIAEILAVFPKWKNVYLSKDFLILENIKNKDALNNANKLWWTIKIVEIFNSTTNNNWISNITDIALESEWKFKYWLSIFWHKKNLREILIKQKKELKWNNISSRFINKDFKNLSSAQIIAEKLINKTTDFNYIYTNNNVYFWRSIWIQDINAYSKRDYSKDRDMQTGMLPPKLCQMMINLSGWNIIYDPFVWLWTVLIEALLIWAKEVYGSDISDKMVEVSSSNLKNFKKSSNIDTVFQIEKLNSKFIEESGILRDEKIDSIVTEWYLWEIMTRKNICIDRIDKQKKSLLELYERFFKWLKKIKYKGNLVICFPFWEMNWKYIYFSEIYELLNIYCKIKDLLPNWFEVEATKSGSLLYKREKQLVWREIFKLKLK